MTISDVSVKIGVSTWLAPSTHTISINCLWEQPMARKYYDKSNLPAFQIPTHYRFKNLTGHRYGRLTVVSYAGRERGATRWFCSCNCGNVVKVRAHSLIAGQTKSCGCLPAELNRTHGKSGTASYKAWQMMIDRCQNPKSTAFHNYGLRGISVCAEWRSFEVFFRDMGDRPTSRHTIERIDNDGNYQPDNCVWAIRQIQANNMRTNRILNIGGKKKTMAQWCGGTNTKHYRRTRSRLQKGWCDDCAVNNEWGVVCSHVTEVKA